MLAGAAETHDAEESGPSPVVLQTASARQDSRLRSRESQDDMLSGEADEAEGRAEAQIAAEPERYSLGQQLLDIIRSPTGIIMAAIGLLMLASWGVPWSQLIFTLVQWIQDIGSWGYIILLLSFILISFPFTFGYTPLALAAGFLYGFVMGVALTGIGSGVGGVVAFVVCRRFLQRDYISHAFRKNKIGMVLFAMGESGWKGALLARMIPFPYGLANAILSMTSISFYRYTVSTFVGLFPFQIMLVYFGTTIRSLADVVSGKAQFGWMQTLVLVLQALITIASIFYFIYVARKYERTSLEQLGSLPNVDENERDPEDVIEEIPV